MKKTYTSQQMEYLQKIFKKCSNYGDGQKMSDRREFTYVFANMKEFIKWVERLEKPCVIPNDIYIGDEFEPRLKLEVNKEEKHE